MRNMRNPQKQNADLLINEAGETYYHKALNGLLLIWSKTYILFSYVTVFPSHLKSVINLNLLAVHNRGL
jgi:hypothetical protein